jgi:hypothetical protein
MFSAVVLEGGATDSVTVGGVEGTLLSKRCLMMRWTVSLFDFAGVKSNFEASSRRAGFLSEAYFLLSLSSVSLERSFDRGS